MDIENILSPRIKKHCMPLCNDGHFKHAAHEAMIQVELALKNKGQVTDNRFGHTLVESLFGKNGKGQHIKLRVPLGQNLQSQAEKLFEGAFSYYRNYSAHDGSKIDQAQCFRIMILASELLDLIDASSLTFSDLGGIEGLIESGVFKSKEQIFGLLRFLNEYHVFDDEFDDSYYIVMNELGTNEINLQALLELDLVRYEKQSYKPDPSEMIMDVGCFIPDTVGWFSLTDMGLEFIKKIEERMAH